MILVVGNLERWAARGRGLPDLVGFAFVAFHSLTPDLLDDLAPEMVLSPLMGEGFDAVELARRLWQLGFAGRYRALTTPLPDLDAVRAEVREAAPDLDFDLYVLRSLAH